MPDMRFEFATAGRIIFGAGTLGEIGRIAREFGQRAFVVTGRRSERAARLLDLLRATKVDPTTFAIANEPTTDDIQRGTTLARAANCDLVIGFGGGAALDTAKAISALVTNGGDVFDYLEVVGRSQPMTRAALPCIAIPTTAGTGSEVTRNAVLSAPVLSPVAAPDLISNDGCERRVKASLRSPLMLPRVALIDPELTLDLPAALTASTGLDALTQLIEPYVSCRANPMTDALCVDGIRRAARSLQRAFEYGGDLTAREDMSLASLFGGLALANAGLGAVHGFAAPIGGMFPAPHGAVCAALLPHVVQANLHALRTRAAKSETLQRYDEIARLLTNNPHATADDGVRWITELTRALGIPALAKYGITERDAPAIVTAAAKASSMKANPIELTADELTTILRSAT
jgi:alcohol dehydrogenase class IV